MRRLVMVLSAMFVVTACTGSAVEEDTGNPDSPSTTGSVPEDGEGTAVTGTTGIPQTTTTPAPEVGEAGIFTVNETEFAVTLLNRCIPFSGSEEDLDLQALAQGEGAKLNLVLLGGTTEVSVDGSGIEEMFGSIAFGENPVVSASQVAGDRWSGSATVGDSLGSGETVDITWDVMVPAEAQDCSL